ncbi:MAG: glycosyltransferase family 2 protein [Tenericutes bacterium]|nr:glycosyltransferase family 2 protein [Mycoplasmatota bacterium]
MYAVLSYTDILLLIAILAAGSLLMGIIIVIQKIYRKNQVRKNFKIQKALTERFIFNKESNITCRSKHFIKNFFQLSQKFKFSQNGLDTVYACLFKRKYIQKLSREINSNKEYKRIRAITYLALFKNAFIKDILVNRLSIEQKDHIRILIVNGLKYHLDEAVIKTIITSLFNSKRYYQVRVIQILKKYVDQSTYDLSQQLNSPLLEVRETFVDIALELYHPNFKKPLLDTLKEIEDHYIMNNSQLLAQANKPRIDRLYYQTLTALSKYYSFDLRKLKYLAHMDDEVVKIAVNSLTKKGDFSTIEYLLSFSSQTQRDYIYTEGITVICEKNKSYYKDIYTVFLESKTNRIKQLIAGVLSSKMDYLILTVKDDKEFNMLISFMIKSSFSINIINWLNYNKNLELEDKILEIIAPLARENYPFYLDLNNYLKKDLFKKMGFIYSYVPDKDRPGTDPETTKNRWLSLFLLICFISLPILFVVFNFNLLLNGSFREVAIGYIVGINKSFVVYYVVVNFLYLFFAFISLFEYNTQERLWLIKNEDFLYEDGILAPISILVPAYNEEISIVDSVRALLSLMYPIYEVIVINDGSKDSTLQKLIDAYELKRVDYVIDKKIATMPIKAVYKNKFHIKLTVVDKENGGKADSLNVGINFSKNDYVCGIDADSIIESNGLLRMMSTVLDHDSITLALGGSIVPVNGATVNHGVVEDYTLPKSILAKFQTIEYIRAFNAGRLGFSRMKCFLIVSGAFGLFEKRMLQEIGGYLTASNMRKDTVGEDMELVVRLARKASEKGLSHRIQYVPMARCYTEVPEERKSLLSQRNRWQRGLIDTLSFHKKMIFNKKYGTNGTIAMPYFFIFEMLGPVMEIQIYLTLVIGLIFGIFNGVLLLLLFTVTIFLGMFATLVSIFLQEKYTEPFTVKDTIKLVFFTIIENFGWRQFISIYRSLGYFTSFKKKTEWGTMKRKGFKTK